MSRINHKRSQSKSSKPVIDTLESRLLYTTAGVLDGTFGSGGSTIPFPMTAVSVAVQPDGKTLELGTINHQFAVGRLDAGGLVDRSFGHNGLALAGFGSALINATCIVVQPDGKILVGGNISEGNPITGSLNALARFNADGTLDTTFGHNGTETVLGNDNFNVSALALQADGKIVFAANHVDNGFLGFGQHTDTEVVRLQKNGALDGTFGDANGSTRRGYVVTSFGDGRSAPVALGIQANGEITVAVNASFDSKPAWMFGRYTTSGRLDVLYGNNGEAGNFFAPGGDAMNAMAVTSDGQIYAAGLNQNREYVSHYTAAGTFDAHFGNNGVFPHGNNISTGFDIPDAVFLPASGKIMIVGSSGNIDVQQLNANGSFDKTFGTGGEAVISVGAGGGYNVAAAAETGDGKIVVVGGTVLNPLSGDVARITEAAPIVSVTAGISNGLEGSHDASVVFSRDQAYDYPTRVFFHTGGTATPLADYTGPLAPVLIQSRRGPILNPNPFITIPAGQASVTIPVHIVNDTIVEPTETLTVTVVPSTSFNIARAFQGGRIILLNTATIIIGDNDGPGVHPLTKAVSNAASLFSDTSIALANGL